MISVAQARAAALRLVPGPLEAQDVDVHEALDRVLAADVMARYDVPAFANAAMDGIALRSGATGRTLRVVGESRAGSPAEGELRVGEAIRISTGAALPAGADAVLQLELLDDSADGTATTTREAVAPGRNVRDAGTDLRAGTIALPAGTALGPAELGVAVSAGVASVPCTRRPRVAIVVTGDELVTAGSPLGPGQIHDSNRHTLAALARRSGADPVTTASAPDDRAGTEAALARAIAEADVVVVSGGVSVGPHDHVKPALAALGVVESFWRVALRPGKPTWCGAAPDGTIVLGLPGNPVSAMVTFALFARPALRALQGAEGGRGDIASTAAHLAASVPRESGRDHMIRVTLDAAGGATPTGAQGSHRLTSMLAADALALIPAGEGDLPAGSEVLVERL